MAKSAQRFGGDQLMTWKQTALSLFVLYVVSMLGLSVYISSLESNNRALGAKCSSLEASLDTVYSQLPDPHETAFGE